MCEITVVNLGDERLNKKAFLVLGSIGSLVHKDGWGFAHKSGQMWKCSIPMHWTVDSGERLTNMSEDGILLGHIRRASPSVPVTVQNAHPFSLEGITFVHNGKLTPIDSKNFVMEEEVPDLDKDYKEQFDKDGNLKMKKVNRSDSKIFFEEFIKEWQVEVLYESLEQQFVEVLNNTMKKFYGKFAFVFIIAGTFFIVKGKTAKLHMSYLKEGNDQDSKSLGWIVNTSDETLNSSTTLLSNLNQLEGHGEMHFTYPESIAEETIFKAVETGLEKIGEIKENSAPVKSYPATSAQTSAWESNKANPTKTGQTTQNSTTTNKTDKEFLELQEKIYNFVVEYSLSPRDIQYIFFQAYGISLRQASKVYLKHFVRKIIPLVANYTNKEIKKSMRSALVNFPVSQFRYESSMEYPWVLNPKNVQNKLVKKFSGG